MSTEKTVKIKTWHSRKCFVEGTAKEHYFPTGEMYFGNYAGNKKRGSYYWIEMGCNDPACAYRAVIKSNVLSALLENTPISPETV